MKSKEIVQREIQALLDSGLNQHDVAHALGFCGDNYISMLKNSSSEKDLLPPTRIQKFAEVCKMGPQDVMRLALARFRDADGKLVRMDIETFKFLLLTFAECVDMHRAAAAQRSLP